MERPRQLWRPETCTQGLWGHVLPLGGKRKLRVSKLISFLKCWAALVVRLTDSVQPCPWKIFCFLCRQCHYLGKCITLTNVLVFQTQVPVSCGLFPFHLLAASFREKGGRGESLWRREGEDRTRMSSSVGKANVEFVKGRSQNVSVQLRAEDGITPPWNQVACLLAFYWFKQNSPWRQLGGVSVFPTSNPKPSPMFLFVNSFYPRSCSDWLPLSE